MDTLQFFFSTKGNLSRQGFLGYSAASILFTIFITFFIALISKLTGKNNQLFFPIMFIAMYINFCICKKRFNDIGAMHHLVHIHFGLLATSILMLTLGYLNVYLIVIVTLNGIFGLVILGIALFKKSGSPICIYHKGKNITFTPNMLQSVNASYVPDFEKMGMLIILHDKEIIAGWIHLVMTKEEYEKKQYILEHADNLYVFQLKDLQ